jgi:hypothetical protein
LKRSLALVALTAGCATHAQLRLAPIAVAAAAGTLQAGQDATLDANGQTVTLAPDQRVDVITTDHRRIARTLADVVRDCRGDADHLCELRGIDVIVVDAPAAPSHAGRVIREIAIITAGLATSGALVYCDDVCRSPYNDLSIAGTVVGIAGFFALAWLTSRD